jgi:hypothetical protein
MSITSMGGGERRPPPPPPPPEEPRHEPVDMTEAEIAEHYRKKREREGREC